MMESRYVKWLEYNGAKVFYGGGHAWRLYQGALIPASPFTVYISLSEDEARKLLKQTGCLFIRYANNPVEKPTSWWYIVCDFYSFDRLSSKMRNQVRRAYRECKVNKISAAWLAENGYECYSSAYKRYNNAVPADEEVFKSSIMATSDADVFEYWGVFVGTELVGYCQCIVENKQVATNVIKYNPDYLKYYSSYALMDSLLCYYVGERNMTMSNGTRSIAHDTNMQDYLLKFGFRKQYCRLNIEYNPWMKMAVNILFPFKRYITALPDKGFIHKIQSVLYQEQIRRECDVAV
jgi:hypothetical protein